MRSGPEERSRPGCIGVVPAVASIVSVGALISTVAFLVWAMRRGFDITDEASYLITAQWPRDVLMMPRADYWFTALLFRAAGETVWGVRLAGLVLTLTANLVLLAGVTRALDRVVPLADPSRLRWLNQYALVLCSALLGYTWFVPTPSYNWINAWAVAISIGSLAAGLTRANDDGHDWWLPWRFACVGLGLAVSFLVKFPTALCLVACSVTAILFWPQWSIARRGRALGGIALGSTMVLLVFLGAVEGPLQWWRTFNEGVAGVGRLRPNARNDVLFRYPREILDYVVKPGPTSALAVVAALLAAGGVFLTLRRRGHSSASAGNVAVHALLGAAACASVAYFCRLDRVEYFRHLARFCFAWLIFCGLATAWWTRNHTIVGTLPVRGHWILACLLFAAPFAASIGSSNTVNVNMMFSFGPWFVLFVALFRAISAADPCELVVDVGPAMLSVFCAGLVIVGAFSGPYRLNTGLASQTQPTQIGSPVSVLLLDPPAGRFFEDLRRLAANAGFKPGDDVLAFFDLPGAVFALGGRSPGTPWFGGYPLEAATAIAERDLALVGPGRVARAFLLQTPENREWLTRLDPRLGITFPGNYVFRGELAIPYRSHGGVVRLWQPVAR